MERSQSGGYIIPGLIASYRLRVMKVHSTNPLTPGKKQNRHLLPLRSIMWERMR